MQPTTRAEEDGYDKAAQPDISFGDAQSWYSALTLFCCMTVSQIVTALITIDIPNFLYIFVIFKPPSGSWLTTVKNNNNNKRNL